MNKSLIKNMNFVIELYTALSKIDGLAILHSSQQRDSLVNEMKNASIPTLEECLAIIQHFKEKLNVKFSVMHTDEVHKMINDIEKDGQTTDDRKVLCDYYLGMNSEERNSKYFEYIDDFDSLTVIEEIGLIIHIYEQFQALFDMMKNKQLDDEDLSYLDSHVSIKWDVMKKYDCKFNKDNKQNAKNLLAPYSVNVEHKESGNELILITIAMTVLLALIFMCFLFPILNF